MGLLKAPVTALEFAGNFVIAGIGSFIRVYDKLKRKAVLSLKVFEHEVVHGFKYFSTTEEHFVVIYGGRNLCVCKLNFLNGDNVSVTTICKRKVVDWIWDLAFIFQSDADANTIPEKVAVALGHNSVVLYDWKKAVTILESHCEEKCILYSAHFVKEDMPTWDSLTLCSGTVFNQVVIWKPGSLGSGSSTAKVLERIQAHDGVIFSMDFDFLSGLLVTASDDRSIRLWTCKSLQCFCPRASMEKQVLTSSSNLCKLYGHESRVWRARCIKYCDNLFLISVGEDGYCIIWSLERRSDGKLVEGSIVKKFCCHKGRNIWSMAIDPTSGRIATGGGDTGIRLFTVEELIYNNALVTAHPFDKCAPSESKGFGVLKSIHMCDGGVILGHTDFGVLLIFHIHKSSWNILHRNENFKSYAIMRVCNEVNTVAIANTAGKVNILHLTKTWNGVESNSEFQALSSTGKIHNMTWFMQDTNPHLLISGPDGAFLCYAFSTSTCDQTRIYSWVLPPAKHRWHMGAVLICMNGMNYAICGDRRGSLHLFKQGMEEPLHTLHGVHGKGGVTSIQILNKSVISTGRDGIWRKIQLKLDSESINVVSQNRAAQGMDWLVSAILPEICIDDLLVLGFHGRNFMVWSSSTGDTLLSVECGGGHRDWSFRVENEKSYLAFIKESTLNLALVHRDVTKQTSVVESHFHGGKITALKHIDSYFDIFGNRPTCVSFLATGSEDTKIFISAILNHFRSGKEGELHHVHLIDDHISSVRALATVKIRYDDKGSATLLFAGGGRATINSYRVTINYNESWKESCKIERISSHTLNTKPERRKLKDCHPTSPETRYMDLSASNKDGMVIIAAACSDAIIRLFQLDIDEKELQLLAQSPVYSHCFLTIRILELDKITCLITGATDGNLRICPADSLKSNHMDGQTKKLPPSYFVTPVHMSGINSMDIVQCPTFLCLKENIHLQENSLLAVTGGDDNSIQILILSLENQVFRILHTCAMPEAHSTQITGLKILVHTEGVELLSTSIDQRITKWKILFDGNELKCQFIASTLTNIADASSLEFWKSSTINQHHPEIISYAVCGQGIQVFDTDFM